MGKGVPEGCSKFHSIGIGGPKERKRQAKDLIFNAIVISTIQKYYDNTIFHRIVKDFIVQGGDPTGTGFGGESIYGRSFNDEFHSRLRFSHRGIVAYANSGHINDNK